MDERDTIIDYDAILAAAEALWNSPDGDAVYEVCLIDAALASAAHRAPHDEKDAA